MVAGELAPMVAGELPPILRVVVEKTQLFKVHYQTNKYFTTVKACLFPSDKFWPLRTDDNSALGGIVGAVKKVLHSQISTGAHTIFLDV